MSWSTSLTRRRGTGGVFFVDFPTLLASVFLALFILTTAPTKKPPSVPTYGQFAVVIKWPGTSRDDVDLYVRDPVGHICFYKGTQVGQMHLEHDDLGGLDSGYVFNGKQLNYERTVIRGLVPGEYVVNVHMFTKVGPLPVRVDAELWTLRGADHVLVKRSLVLRRQSEQETEFRVTLDARGATSQVSSLPADLFGKAKPSGPDASPYSPTYTPPSGGGPASGRGF